MTTLRACPEIGVTSDSPVLERVVKERKSSSIHDLVPWPPGLKPPGSSACTTTNRYAKAQARRVKTAGIANSSSVVTSSSASMYASMLPAA